MNDKLMYKRATSKNLDEIYKMFRAAVDEMERNGIHQWDDIYPDRITLSEDISRGQMYVGNLGGHIVCAYVLNGCFDNGYRFGDWRYSAYDALVIHRLCVHPRHQNCGIARETMLHIESQAAELGALSLRLDVFSRNPYALKLYEKLGYRRAGSVTWRMGEFYLMEKPLCRT